MKRKTAVPACVCLLLSLVIAVGSVSFLSPCIHEDGSFGACHWAGQAMLGIGCLLSLISAIALLVRNGQVRTGLYLAALLTGILGALVPGTLISLCRMSTMRCRAVMQPAMILLCAGIMLSAAAGLLTERRQSGKK